MRSTSRRGRIEKACRERRFLRHAVEELSQLAPQAGEENALAERAAGHDAGGEGHGRAERGLRHPHGKASPVAVISSALRKLERRGTQAPELVADRPDAGRRPRRLRRSQRRAEEALRKAEFEPRDPESTEERLFGLRAAGRKYDVPADELHLSARAIVAEVAAIDAARASRRAREGGGGSDKAFLDEARALSLARAETAAALDAVVQAELPPLKLERARFITQIDVDENSRDASGFDKVEFGRRRTPGRARPDDKLASGGELSCFMLALKVVRPIAAPCLPRLRRNRHGVGGAVADAIGSGWRGSAATQATAVTHAPQVGRGQAAIPIAKEPVSGSDRVADEVGAAQRRSAPRGDRPHARGGDDHRRSGRRCGRIARNGLALTAAFACA